MSGADGVLFPGFAVRDVATRDARIRVVAGGHGPALLLLHGYPQTHAMWHPVAAALAREFTVVCPDLPGYGDSEKKPGDVRHERHSKRATAQAMVDVMAAFGHDRFALAGHDRGARVAHRLCLDHPAAVARVAMLDVAPTRTVFARIDRALATDYYHWFWFIQPYDLPERLIGADPSWYLRRHMQAWAGRLDYFHPLALAEYERCFALPGTVHATCEDYRAAASIDLAHDDDDAKAGRRIECPLLALWGERGLVPRHFDVPAVWRDCARDVRGQGIAAGHALVEEAPAATLRALRAFFAV